MSEQQTPQPSCACPAADPAPVAAPCTGTEPASGAAAPQTPAEGVVKPRIGAYRRHLLVCTGPRCTQHGESQQLFDALGAKFKAAGLDQGDLRVKRTRVSCFAACKGGPVVCVQPDGTWYYNVTPENMDRIIAQHLVGGQPVEDLVFHQA